MSNDLENDYKIIIFEDSKNNSSINLLSNNKDLENNKELNNTVDYNENVKIKNEVKTSTLSLAEVDTIQINGKFSYDSSSTSHNALGENKMPIVSSSNSDKEQFVNNKSQTNSQTNIHTINNYNNIVYEDENHLNKDTNFINICHTPSTTISNINPDSKQIRSQSTFQNKNDYKGDHSSTQPSYLSQSENDDSINPSRFLYTEDNLSSSQTTYSTYPTFQEPFSKKSKSFTPLSQKRSTEQLFQDNFLNLQFNQQQNVKIISNKK